MDPSTVSIIVVPMLIWVVGFVLSLLYRWRNPKKYFLTLIAFISFLISYIGLFNSMYWLIPTIFTMAGWGTLLFAVFNPQLNPTDNEKLTKEEKKLLFRTAAIGIGTGIAGAIIGFFPILSLHYKLWDLVKNTAMPHKLTYLFIGYPMPWTGLIFLPIGGALFGCVEALIGLKRHFTDCGFGVVWQAYCSIFS